MNARRLSLLAFIAALLLALPAPAQMTSVGSGGTSGCIPQCSASRVYNGTGGTLMIPYNTCAEWTSLRNNPPGGVTFPSCCGDGSCNNGETCSTCPGDCGSCGPTCGANGCEAGETCSSCPGDCGYCPCTTAAGTYPHGSSPTLYYYWDTYCSLGQDSSTCGTYSQTKTCNDGSWSGGDFSSGYTATSCTFNNCASCAHPNYGTVAHGQTVTGYYYWDTYCTSGHNSSTCAAYSEQQTCNNGSINITPGYTATSCTWNDDCAAPCNLPWGGSIASGQGVTAYRTATICTDGGDPDCNFAGQSEWRACNNGTLSGSFTQGSCSLFACTAGKACCVNMTPRQCKTSGTCPL